jgi:hypothetical protein
MNEVIDLIKSLDLHTIIVIGVLFGYFTRNLEKSIREEIHLINSKMNEQSLRTDKLYEMFIDLVKETKK